MELTYHPHQIIYERDGQPLASIDFPPVAEGVVSICHTFVDPVLRGQGVAGKLMEAAIAHIRAQGWRVMADCSYADKWFCEHPAERDLLCADKPASSDEAPPH
ncbi:MAG: N-acetyltransferase [Clostridiales bacterium]|nr:N-acetyltransferase [Clostridiales bacterium]